MLVRYLFLFLFSIFFSLFSKVNSSLSFAPLHCFSFFLPSLLGNKSVHCPYLVPTRGLIVGIMVMIIAVTDFPIISSTKQLLKCTYCCDLISTQEQEMSVCAWMHMCVRERELNWCLGRVCTGLCTALFHVFAVGFSVLLIAMLCMYMFFCFIHLQSGS